ncbi:Retroelement [Phytophthora megakarya]|uniref:Retroelement n=1 Tax=Phytophthora megakarya TaxID=4795 RepID=A0A225W8Q7_9STRA|nr:Retroelement [Phytophthora megakarya]
MLRRRRQAQTEDSIIDENVNSMLEAGVIEHGNDHRALNAVTKKDVYPLPRNDETLESFGGAQLFTTLDFRVGYRQVRVVECERDKTAFITKRGLFSFRRMPLGLSNTPATFQRLMNGVFRGLTWTSCLVYLDDTIVFSRGNIEEHVVKLASNLKVENCAFATKSMEYLGHLLSESGVRTLVRLITAVAEFPRLTDPEAVRRFVHLAGYYRRFLQGCGSIRLLKKDVEWNGTELQEFCVWTIQNDVDDPTLASVPGLEQPFRLVTDASQQSRVLRRDTAQHSTSETVLLATAIILT